MIDPKTIWLVFLTIVVFTLVFIAPHFLHHLLPDETSAAERGCVASAYQATRYGHDLEANLQACNEL